MTTTKKEIYDIGLCENFIIMIIKKKSRIDASRYGEGNVFIKKFSLFAFSAPINTN